MVLRELPAGGSAALADLIDRYGEGLQFDFYRYGLPPLVEFVNGQRRPSEAIRLIGVLPADSATAAMMRARPPEGSTGKPPAWRAEYGWGVVANLLADLWDAQVATAVGGKKGGRKPPVHPRTKSMKTAPRRRPKPGR